MVVGPLRERATEYRGKLTGQYTTQFQHRGWQAGAGRGSKLGPGRDEENYRDTDGNAFAGDYDFQGDELLSLFGGSLTARAELGDTLSLESISGFLIFDSNTVNDGVGLAQWDGEDQSIALVPDGLGGIDLTDGSEAFAFNFGIDAAGQGETLMLRVFSGNAVSSAAIEIPVTEFGTATELRIVPFSEFTGDADFTNVESIQLQFGGTNSSIDAQLGPIGLVGPTFRDIPVIPEPSGMLLSTFAFLGLGAFRKRSRSR